MADPNILLADGEPLSPGDTVFVGRDGLLHKSVAQPGHNSGEPGGLPSVETLISELEAENKAAMERTAALLEKGKDFLVIDSDEADSAATEYLVKLRARYKQSEADRVAAKTPWDDRAGAVHAFFKTRILDPLGLAPGKADESFDPVTATAYGIGPRINMALTLYKRAKAERERKAREAEAARLREVERLAREQREKAERERRAQEAAAQKARDDAARAAREAAERAAAAERERARAAQAEADALALAASRKRNEESKAAAEKAAAEARKRAEAEATAAAERARITQEAADRQAEANAREAARVEALRLEREAADREAENRLAAERSKAEEAAGASAADLSRARGQKGGVSSLREFVSWRDVDRAKLDYAALGPYFKDAAIEAALKAFADANKATVSAGIKSGNQPIAGVVYFIDSKAAGRA